MPASQLKRLKTSLRENGILGPQKPKKKKAKALSSDASNVRRNQRGAILQNIRDQFNPFEYKAPVRKSKVDITNPKLQAGKIVKGVKGRPGVTKGLGEEVRRKTLLVEMQRRNKVGGITDARFGENDPTMTPEEKMLERFTREKQRRFRTSSVFDLETEGDTSLTHFGKSLTLDDTYDDYDHRQFEAEESDQDLSKGHSNSRKRPRPSDFSEQLDGEKSQDEENDEPEKKKTRAEVMKEVISKSKLHKYERQQAKDEDDDMREELDKELPNIYALIHSDPRLKPSQAQQLGESINPARAALLNGESKLKSDKEYDERLKQMLFDKRSKPTERTKTEEEKIADEAVRLKDLEEARLRRMRGDPESGDESDENADNEDDETFGLGPGIKSRSEKWSALDEEDDFLIDDDLVASGSGLESSEEFESDVDADELIKNDRGFSEAQQLVHSSELENRPLTEEDKNTHNAATHKLAFTYICPQSLDEMIDISRGIPFKDLHIVIQRIRTLYHPSLQDGNKTKLGVFAAVLVDHIAYLANQPSHPTLDVLESLIRHVHSLAKTFPIEVAQAFRTFLLSLQQKRPTDPAPGDLILLTAIGSIFPTSDHFHQVVTPANLSMTKYLAQKKPQSLRDLIIGAYLVTLCLQYQRLSKRYIPEAINYSYVSLCLLSPTMPKEATQIFPYTKPTTLLCLNQLPEGKTRGIRIWEVPDENFSSNEINLIKASLIETHMHLLEYMATLWAEKSAFIEMFTPAISLLNHLSTPACLPFLPETTATLLNDLRTSLASTLTALRKTRLPLLLHNHRPLAIRTSIPKFETTYDPTKHYDPDAERAASSKLRAEHKRERKGAMRELRKDASFMARETLREKKVRDAEYERKYKRLVAEIQGEEGREAKGYEREKRARKSGGRK
ncbi:MAG: nucleolar complex protein 14 [Trizodia sp. TS-e1964]|nr:MAG: nucleolar complex protein 14 [Trizodia sp. TS-e1964]